MRLENKIALLCGVGRGMGKAVAMLYAQEGATVVLNARTTTHLEKTASEIKTHGGTAHIMPGDISNKHKADQLVDEVTNILGPVDTLYSAAGGNFDPGKKTTDINSEFWDQTIQNTLNSYFNVTQSIRPIMKENSGGSIVAVAASFNVRQSGNAAYSAAKNGIILASSGNPRQFIQRRGRLLRTSKDKPFAHIFDFIVVPNYLSTTSENTANNEPGRREIELSIFNKELRRIEEFSHLAINYDHAEEVISAIREEYEI